MTTLTSKEIPLILIVDDDATSRIMARAYLETNGFSVVEAEDGMGALSTFENFQPDIVLLEKRAASARIFHLRIIFLVVLRGIGSNVLRIPVKIIAHSPQMSEYCC